MDLENANCKFKVSECADLEQLTLDRPIKVHQEITGLEMLVEELHRVFSHDHVNVQDVQKLMAGYKSNPKDWKKFAKFDRFRYTRNLVDAGIGAFNIMILCWGPGHASAIHDHADSHCFMKMLSGNLEEIRYDWPENAEPEVLKKLRNNNKNVRRSCSEGEDQNGSELTDLNSNCQNDGCQNYGGRVDRQNGRQNGSNQDGGRRNGEKQDGGDQNDNYSKDYEDEAGYDAQHMKEIGRTRLELNDVCYINDAIGLHRVENPSHVDGAVSLHLYCPPFDSCRVFDARTGKPTRVPVTFWSMYGKKIQRVVDGNHISDSQ